MEDRFRDTYRIPSNRLRGWDYSSNGHYYITIVTAGRNRLFGEINDGEMVLNEMGQIVYDEFFKSFELRDELFLGAFVLMPDHIHAIVILDHSKCTVGNVETHGRASLQGGVIFLKNVENILPAEGICIGFLWIFANYFQVKLFINQNHTR